MTTEGYLVISNGVTRRKVKGQKCNSLLGILPDGSFKYYESNPYSDVYNDGVKDSFTFGPLIIKNGKKYTQKKGSRKSYSTRRYATLVGQVDENNYIIITAKGTTTLYNLQNVGMLFNCKLLFNMDGGGSSSLWFRGKTSGAGKKVKGCSRKVADALYFTSLN